MRRKLILNAGLVAAVVLAGMLPRAAACPLHPAPARHKKPRPTVVYTTSNSRTISTSRTNVNPQPTCSNPRITTDSLKPLPTPPNNTPVNTDLDKNTKNKDADKPANDTGGGATGDGTGTQGGDPLGQ